MKKSLQLNGKEHLIIGIIGAFWSAGMIYFAKAGNIPSIVKPFLFSWWIEEEGANRFLGLILGILGMIGSFFFIIAGLTGQKICLFYDCNV